MLTKTPKERGWPCVCGRIADVAAYGPPPGLCAGREARKTGQFDLLSPDRVVPMLPDRLSGDLCSLHEGVARACYRGAMVVGFARANKIGPFNVPIAG